MIKKITVGQLKAGVFVQHFNRGLLPHPFLAEQKKLKTDRDIEKVVKYGIRELYIDTDRGLDIDDAATEQEAEEAIQSGLDQLVPLAPAQNSRRVLGEEIARAKQLIGEAKLTTQKLMHDVKLGKRMEINQLENVVEQMTDSVLHNRDALVSLLRIKNVDEYTYLHSMAVSALCISFAHGLEFDDAPIKQIVISGLLHDNRKMHGSL